jgi:hypothetical protein
MHIAIIIARIAADTVVTITGMLVLLPAITTAATAAQTSTMATIIAAANVIMAQVTLVM